MHRIATLLAATAAIAIGASSVLAADIVPYTPPPPPPLPQVAAGPAFVGPYWGTYGGYWRLSLGGGLAGPIMGTQFGYNFEGSEKMRLGLELETEFTGITTLIDATINGRLGVVMGNSGNVLLYTQLGLGTLAPALPTYSAGAGVEFLLNPSLSAFVEGKASFFLGPGGFVGWSARAGINYYADRQNADIGGAFDWHGMYLGAILGGGRLLGGNFGTGGLQVGYNFGQGNFIIGAEIETTHLFPLPAAVVQASLNGRAGVAIGDVLVYGEAGIGTLLTVPIVTAGGGLEWAVGERMALTGEGEAVFAFGGGGFVGWQATGGVNMHFGR